MPLLAEEARGTRGTPHGRDCGSLQPGETPSRPAPRPTELHNCVCFKPLNVREDGRSATGNEYIP